MNSINRFSISSFTQNCRDISTTILIIFLLLLIVILLQNLSHAYSVEFTGDEASHYVYGLFVYEYIFNNILNSPFAYLRYFFSHYPLVGNWPPFYHFIEAICMEILSPSRVSMLLLSAIMSVTTAFCCYQFSFQSIGRPAAIFAAFAFVLSPITQRASSELMLDVPVACFCFGATVAYARYLRTEQLRYALAFSIAASAAILTKGNGALLVLLPPFAVLFGRRLELLRSWTFWLPIPVVAVIAGPWHIATYKFAAQGFRFQWGLDYIKTATTSNTDILISAVGIVVTLAGAIGFIVIIIRSLIKNQNDYFMACVAALFGAVWIFQSVVPAAIQDRYLAPALPPLLILSAWATVKAVQWLRDKMPLAMQLRTSSMPTTAILLLALSFLPVAIHHQVKPHLGMIEAASVIWANRIASNPSVLITTDAIGEGAAIAELAMADPNRPSLFAIRGTRLLGGGGYNNQEYVARFKTAEQVMQAIDEYAIPFVLVSTAADQYHWKHLQQIEQAKRLYPDRWELIYPSTNVPAKIEVFRIRGNPEQTANIPRLRALSAPKSLP